MISASVTSRGLPGVQTSVMACVVTLEDGILDGGFGEKISRFYSDKSMNVLNYGATKEFTDRVNLNELYERYRLREDLMIEDIKKLLK